MNFINDVKTNALPFIMKNYAAILVIISLLLALINIIITYTKSNYEKNCQKQLNVDGNTIKAVNVVNIIIVILLSIFVFDFIFNKKYILEVVAKPEFNIPGSILGFNL